MSIAAVTFYLLAGDPGLDPADLRSVLAADRSRDCHGGHRDSPRGAPDPGVGRSGRPGPSAVGLGGSAARGSRGAGRCPVLPAVPNPGDRAGHRPDRVEPPHDPRARAPRGLHPGTTRPVCSACPPSRPWPPPSWTAPAAPGIRWRVLLMDLDGLKKVNTDHGHLAGDQYIAAMARLLADASRSYDLVARFGGDEFCLLLPDTPLPDAIGLRRADPRQRHHHPDPGRHHPDGRVHRSGSRRTHRRRASRCWQPLTPPCGTPSPTAGTRSWSPLPAAGQQATAATRRTPPVSAMPEPRHARDKGPSRLTGSEAVVGCRR